MCALGDKLIAQPSPRLSSAPRGVVLQLHFTEVVMNLAVVISVSEYQYASALPGCKLDAQHMQHMLQLTGRFDDILVLDQSPSTPDMRTHLNDWVKRNKGQLVDEV
ncbi:MAG: hypothetical protein EB096_01980, partial [Betaproteobacteria bacterium]|nr:hypothetical protein [Betaproteobacteria bacterium]